MHTENTDNQLKGKLIEGASSFLSIPVLVYYVGFIYASGFFSPMTKYNIFNLSFRGAYPFSNYNVYICGGFQTLKLVIVCVAAWILWIMAEQLGRRLVKEPIGLRNNNIWKITIVNAPTIISVVPFLVLLWLCNMVADAERMETIYLYAIEVLLFFSYILCIKCIEYCKQVCVLNNWLEDKVTVLSRIGMFYLIAFTTLTGAIYFNGFQEQVNLIQDYNSGKGDYTVADVYSDSESYRSYIEMDATADSFVGYDQQLKVITTIPMDKVEKINRKTVHKEDGDSQK